MVALLARYAVLLRALEFDCGIAIDDAVAAIAIERLARRADAGVGGWVVVEVCGPINSGLPLPFVVAGLVVQRMGGLLVFALIIETWIALPHAVVGDQGIDLQLGELFEVAFRVVTRISGDEAAAGDERGNNQCAFDRLDHRDEQFLFAAGAESMGSDTISEQPIQPPDGN